MKTKLSKFSQLLCAALACAALTQTLHAGIHTWHGEGFFGNKTRIWSDPFNWAEGPPTPGEANLILIFPPDTDTYVTNDIAGLVVDQIQITGTNVKPEYRPQEQMFVTHRVGSTEKAERMLDFRARITLDEGLRSMVEWRREDQERPIDESLRETVA